MALMAQALFVALPLVVPAVFVYFWLALGALGGRAADVPDGELYRKRLETSTAKFWRR
jgi:hypothetical protein